MKLFLLSIVIVLILNSCVSLPYDKKPQSSLDIFQNEINALVQDSLLANAHIGVYIESLPNGKVLFRINEGKLFLPASNQKLFTSAVAIEKLGAGFQFKTEVYTSGEVSDSVLHGNLLIRGMGDPSISGKYYDDDELAVFNSWADSILDKGIKKVNGNIIGLDGYFTDYMLGKGWSWDDEPYWYSAQISALSYNDNCIDITLIAGKEIGDSVRLIKKPEIDYADINYTISTISADSVSKITYTRQRAKNVIEMEGSISVGDTLQKSITIEKPSLWFITVLKDVFLKRGIKVEGDLLTGSMPFEIFDGLLQKQFTYHSPPLKELIKEVNTPSQNFYAEQIFKTLGAELKQNGSAKQGAEVVQEWLKEIGVDESLTIIADGSGLSRMNLVSPIATASVLRYMYNSPNYNYFYGSLPLAGVEGTLKNRMTASIAHGVLRAKTGFLTHARNLAGYTSDRFGNDYLFVIMVNNYAVPTSYINKLQDKIGVLVTSYNPN